MLVNGFEFRFERRRYGNVTFTWAFILSGDTWTSCGDPWPSVRVPRSDLVAVVEQVRKVAYSNAVN